MKKRKLKKEDILSDRMGIECLIFDFDGTLAETEEHIEMLLIKLFT